LLLVVLVCSLCFIWSLDSSQDSIPFLICSSAVAFARQFATIQRCGSPKALAVQAKVSAQGPMLGQSSLGVFGETWKNCWSESQVAARCGKCKKPNDERIQAVKQ
jgi:hypothetical protein